MLGAYSWLKIFYLIKQKKKRKKNWDLHHGRGPKSFEMVKTKRVVGGLYSGRGPLKTVIIPFILKTKLGLILQAEAQKCLFTKMVGAYTLRDAQVF